MPAIRTLIIAGVLTLVVGIVVAFPARIAYQWLAPDAVTMDGISGTLWNGRAHEAGVAGFYLTDVEWRFHPLALLTGRVKFAVSAVPASGDVQADVSAGADGRVELSNVVASLPVSSFDKIIDAKGLAGQVDVRLRQFAIEDGLPVEAFGTVGVRNLVIRPLTATSLGDFKATLETADGIIRGNVEDESGVLDLTGAVELRPDRSYSFTGLIGTRNGAPAAVDQQLQYLGSADSQGRRRFRLEGQL